VLRSGHVAVEVAAAPEVAYDVLADVTRLGELSDELESVTWVDGASDLTVGARFRTFGRYRGLRWHRTCEVLSSERGRAFAYRTLPSGPLRHITEFRFHFDSDGTVTRVTADSVLVRAGMWIRFLTRILGRPQAQQRDLEIMLGRLKAIAERRAA
jgi:hypothetical protein